MSGVEVLRKYFGGVKSVELAELKRLSAAERAELAQAAAAQMGLRQVNADGKVEYV